MGLKSVFVFVFLFFYVSMHVIISVMSLINVCDFF